MSSMLLLLAMTSSVGEPLALSVKPKTMPRRPSFSFRLRQFEELVLLQLLDRLEQGNVEAVDPLVLRGLQEHAALQGDEGR